jgi:hypothetical protein
MKNSIKLTIAFLSAILIANPVFAYESKTKINFQTESDGVVQWTFDSPIKVPKKGCKNVKVKYKQVGGPREISSALGIIDNSNNDVAYATMMTHKLADNRDKRSGTKYLKICAGIKPGTYDAFIESTGFDVTYAIAQTLFTIKMK